MSIQSEIERIKANVSDTYDAVAEMGGVLPEEQNSDNLAGAVMSIPKGGGTGGGVPVGTVITYLGNTPPDGYLRCNGTVHNISDYPALAAFIESEYGAKDHFGGDGTETFAVPDLSGRFLLGSGAGYILGNIGGQKRVILSKNEMPPHDHDSFSISNYRYTITSVNTASPYLGLAKGSSSGQLSTKTGSTGGSGSTAASHDNMPPYFTVSLIIKAE